MRKVSPVRTTSGQTAANRLDSPLYTQEHYTKIINQRPRPQVKATSDWSPNPGHTHSKMMGDRIKVKINYADGTKGIKYMTPEEYTNAQSEEFLSNPFE
tara:strand:- start:239 stop:535 length:297 start_codon:yes stop_codon:yes gene_type:complete